MLRLKCGLFAFVLLLLTPVALGALTLYDVFEKELLNETISVPAEKYSFVSFYISLAGKTQNRVFVEMTEISGKYVNIYVFDESNFKLYTEGKTAGPIFSARAEKAYSKVFIPEKSGDYYVVIENNDPFKKMVKLKVTWKYGVSAPDLIPEFLESHPSEVFYGEKVYVDFRVKNFSPVKAGEHEIAVYLEGENGGLYEIARVKVGQILAEETKDFSAEKLITETIPRGLYKVKIVADSLNQVEEYNESNNEVYGAKIFVAGSSKTLESKRTPGFEILLSLVALFTITLLLRRK